MRSSRCRKFAFRAFGSIVTEARDGGMWLKLGVRSEIRENLDFWVSETRKREREQNGLQSSATGVQAMAHSSRRQGVVSFQLVFLSLTSSGWGVEWIMRMYRSALLILGRMGAGDGDGRQGCRPNRNCAEGHPRKKSGDCWRKKPCKSFHPAYIKLKYGKVFWWLRRGNPATILTGFSDIWCNRHSRYHIISLTLKPLTHLGAIVTLGLLGTVQKVIRAKDRVTVEGRNLVWASTLRTWINFWQGFLVIGKRKPCYISLTGYHTNP